NLDIDLHLAEGVGHAEIDPMQRDRLTRIARHRDADQVAAADDAVGRIELDPARARQVDLHPGVSRSAPAMSREAIVRRAQVTRDKPRSNAEPPQRLDHQERVVTTGAGARLQRVERMLRALLMTLAIGEVLTDAMSHRREDVE